LAQSQFSDFTENFLDLRIFIGKIKPWLKQKKHTNKSLNRRLSAFYSGAFSGQVKKWIIIH
jgi:hypothetical protein